MERETLTLRLPPPLTRPEPRPFPFLLVFMPVGAAAAISLIARSELTLLFALLGPVMGVASWIDAQVAVRRRMRRERADRSERLITARAQVRAMHERIRRDRRSRVPLLEDIANGTAPPSEDGKDGELTWCVGTDVQPSGIRISGDPGEDRELLALVAEAEMVTACPATVTARAIAVRGPEAQVRATTRVLQLHALARGLEDVEVGRRIMRCGPEDPPIGREIPELIIEPTPGGRTRLVEGVTTRYVHLETVSEATERQLRAQYERRRGDDSGEWSKPLHLALPAVQNPAAGPPATPFPFAVAVHSGEPVVIDLLAHGPHAIIGGTTGSGKSELLLSWVAALTAASGPDRWNVLGLDFKGGATFDAIAQLPHCAGIVTDLDDPAEIERTVESLRAEIRQREQCVREGRVRTLDDLPSPPPRLLIVVDEFQALVQAHPGVHDVMVDLASRGRSLGIHLIICTQRPAGSVRDALLANCTIRISLRVTSEVESRAVVGVPDAASFAPSNHGRALVRIAGSVTEVRIAQTLPHHLEAIAARWRGKPSAKPVVLPPLPRRVSVGELERRLGGERFEGDTVPITIPGTSARGTSPDVRTKPAVGGSMRTVLGLADEPSSQSQDVITLSNDHLVVLGGPSSGKTTALATAVRMSGDGVRTLVAGVSPGAAWRFLEEAERVGSGDHPVQLVLDDADALTMAFDEGRRHEFVERVGALVRRRDGRVRVVFSLQRPAPPWSAVLPLIPDVLILRIAAKADALILLDAATGGPAGAAGFAWLADAPPGRGLFRGRAIQVAQSPHLPLTPVRVHSIDEITEPFVVVSRRASIRAHLAAAGYPDTIEPGEWNGVVEPDAQARRVPVGDPEQWLQRPTALAGWIRSGACMFDGVTPGEVRALIRGSATPPPVDHPAEEAVMRWVDGTWDPVRVVAPTVAPPRELPGGAPRARVTTPARGAPAPAQSIPP